MLRNNNNNKHKTKSGADWSEEYNIQVISFLGGWKSLEEYVDGLISRDEYFNRLSLSKIKIPEVKSRRDARAFLEKLKK